MGSQTTGEERKEGLVEGASDYSMAWPMAERPSEDCLLEPSCSRETWPHSSSPTLFRSQLGAACRKSGLGMNAVPGHTAQQLVVISQLHSAQQALGGRSGWHTSTAALVYHFVPLRYTSARVLGEQLFHSSCEPLLPRENFEEGG